MGDMADGHRVYLDHAASSPLVPEARDAMIAAWTVEGNPHSVHAAGRAARRVLEDARESLAADVGAHPTEIVFTAGGTEADNLAVAGARNRPGRPRIVTTALEHPAIARAVVHHAVTQDADGRDVVGVDEGGHLRVGGLRDALAEDVALVSAQWVNNEVGTVQPVAEVADAARAVGAWSHSDAAQALGHLPIDFAATGLDMMTLAAHKVGGPVGVGALVMGRGLSLAASSFGGGQEREVRSGTQSIALASGFAAAVRRAVAGLGTESTRLWLLRDRLVRGIAETVDDIRVNGEPPIGPAVLNVTFRGVQAADLQFLLDREGIDCSTGSACHAGVVQPSDVLLAMGRSVAEASASLRFSFGWTSTVFDVDTVLRVLPRLVRQAREAA
jgi:cysteine desulfurase